MSEYKEDLFSDLRDCEYAAEYLTAARAESLETFLLAIRDVVEAQKGMARVAARAGVNRENLYRMLSEGGNPRLTSLDAVLQALGLQIRIEPIAPAEQPQERTGKQKLARGSERAVKRPISRGRRQRRARLRQ